MGLVMPDNWRVPFVYAKLDASRAGLLSTPERALILAQKIAAGTAPADVPVRIGGASDAVGYGGAGSHFARMAQAYRENDPFGELWGIPLDDPTGSPSAGAITYTGTATEAGQINHLIAGQRVSFAVPVGMTATQARDALVAEIGDLPDLEVTAAAGVPAGEAVITAKNDGTIGDKIDLRDSYFAGEAVPAGLSIGYTAMTAGAGAAPSLTAAIAAMGDDLYDFILTPFALDTTALDALKVELDDNTGRWSPLRQLYGHHFSALTDTVANLTTYGSGLAARNDQHYTSFGYYLAPSPPWTWVAAHVGQIAASIRNLSSQPLQTLEPAGIYPAAAGSLGRFTVTERQQLLESGIAVSTVNAVGNVAIDRVITSYRQTSSGALDTSYLDYNTMAQLTEILRRTELAIVTDFNRHVLMNDGARTRAGLPVATPNKIKATIVAEYRRMEEDALVENIDAFKTYLIVERSTVDPNRVEVLFPPDLANQLRVVDLLAQFRLQYATAA